MMLKSMGGMLDRGRGHRVIALCLGIVTLCATSLIGVTTEATAASSSSVSVTVIAPLTGSAGVYIPWVDAIKGTVKAINAKGGANGHKIKLTVCDAGESNNTEQACGEKAVQDKSVGIIDMEAAVAPFTEFTDPHDIPRFGFIEDPLDGTDPLSFETADAGGSAVQGTVALAKHSGCTNLAWVREDPGSASAIALKEAAITASAKTLKLKVEITEVPTTATSVTSYVATALASNPDCMIGEGFGAPEVSLLEAEAQQAPSSVQLFTIAALINPAAATSLGSVLNRVKTLSFSWPVSSAASQPGVRLFESVMKKYDPKPYQLDNNSQNMWANTMALAAAIGKVSGPVTAKKVYAELRTFKNYNTNIGPPVSFDVAMKAPVPPRIYAPYGIAEKFVNGTLVADGGFFNMFTGNSVK